MCRHIAETEGSVHSFVHGLRMPNEVFFHKNPKLLGISVSFITTHFGTLSSIIQPLFLQKTKFLYTNPKCVRMDLGLGLKFGPQRIKYLAIVCPY